MKKIKQNSYPATSNLLVNVPDNEKNIVLYFYPKDATPGCTTEGQDFRDNYQSFLDNNCLVYGVSKDNINKHEKFKAKQKFPFELIADIDGKLCELFEVWQLKKFMGREYMGIVRSTFIINPKGEILKQWDNVKVKGHVLEVLGVIKSL
ncbi:Thiol peroxidase, Bcp-type [hydrothermal vent metagenome]|uniref:thioredoxin-dependent peroxiredoxin n=1 Tax=hydrothermal vent metagenome TaxID=652676 RepID=A0A1W1C7E2_9ZZZZ